VAMAPDPDDVLEAALPVLVAWATWMPKPVDVSVTVEPPVVTVVVTTEVAVVEAVHPVQVVQGACVFHEPEVQPAVPSVYTLGEDVPRAERGSTHLTRCSPGNLKCPTSWSRARWSTPRRSCLPTDPIHYPALQMGRVHYPRSILSGYRSIPIPTRRRDPRKAESSS